MPIKKTVEKRFESSVNSEGIETESMALLAEYRFESSVNSEGIETMLSTPYKFI